MLTLCVAVLPIKVIVIANDAANLNIRARERACYVRYVYVCVCARAHDWRLDDGRHVIHELWIQLKRWYRWNVAMQLFRVHVG